MKIGLALGSGGIKGLAHIGVLEVLEKENVEIDIIAGSSAGAFIGAFYCAFKSVKEIKELALKTNWKNLLGFLAGFKNKKFLNLDKIENFLEKYLGKINFNDLKIPLKVVATDFKTGEKFIIEEGKVTKAVLASIAVPFIFGSVKFKNHLLIDGAFSLPVPVELIKDCNLKIAVSLQDDVEPLFLKRQNMIYILNRSIKILQKNLSSSNLKFADIIIRPNFRNISLKDIFDKSKFIERGKKAAQDALKYLK